MYMYSLDLPVFHSVNAFSVKSKKNYKKKIRSIIPACRPHHVIKARLRPYIHLKCGIKLTSCITLSNIWDELNIF